MAEKNYGNNSQLAELMKYISDTMKFPIMGAGGGFAPIGTINFFDASAAPEGWLACDGTVYSISDYPELATFYASVHGASNFYGGNGTTTFAVPDLRGEFLRGSGTNSHENQGSGANVGVHQDGTEHKNMLVGRDSGKLFISKSSVNEGVPNTDSEFDKGKITDIGLSSSSQDVGLKTFYTSRPTNTSFLICVKATVAGDPNAHVYSTEEQVVGKWIDGSDIYERTVYLQSVHSKNTEITINSLDKIINYYGTCDDSGGNITWAIPRVVADGYTVGVGAYGNNVVQLTLGDVGAISRISNIYIVFQYTKTS